MATLVGAAAALAPASSQSARVRADDGPVHVGLAAGLQRRVLLADKSGAPPPNQHLRAIVAHAMDDSIATWKRLIGRHAVDVDAVHLRFVARLKPNNCYGLYAGEGPAYCSGNQTVFVGTDEAKRLMARLGPQGEAGITFLIGHEMGHHIQNIYGRFRLLNYWLARMPWRRVDLMRRFELEADCYAGVWIHASRAWAKSARFRSDMFEVLAKIGDDSVLPHEPQGRIPLGGVHGTGKQRTRWFMRGARDGDWRACNTFAAANP
jgi:predicted metalloprotease